MKTKVFLLFTLCILISCSSPESDGKLAARKYCDCEKNRMESINHAYQKFLRDFKSYNFKSRVEAREKIAEFEKEIEMDYLANKMDADDFYKKVKNRYLTNFEKNLQFEYAFNQYYNANIKVENSYIQLEKQVNKQIANIIPPKPDIEKVCLDLVGRKFTEKETVEFPNLSWEITDNLIKQCDIISEEQCGDEYTYNIHLILQENGGKYEVDIHLFYVLFDNESDWKIDFVESKGLKVIRTGKYNGCITANIEGINYEYSLNLVNHCDVELVIRGQVLNQSTNKWQDFIKIIKPNGKETVGCWFFLSVEDFRIDFIERPLM